MGPPARWQQVLGGVAAAAVLYRQRCSASLIVAQWISGGGRGGEAGDGFDGAAEREDAPERPRSALLMMVALGG